MNAAQLVIYLYFRFLSIFQIGTRVEKKMKIGPGTAAVIKWPKTGQDLWASLSDFVYIKTSD